MTTKPSPSSRNPSTDMIHPSPYGRGIGHTQPSVSENWVRVFVCVLAIFTAFTSMSAAWTITKELEQEIQTKKAAMKQSPADPAAIFDLAITYAYTNHIEEGLALLGKVEKSDPTYKNKAYRDYYAKIIASPSDWKTRFRLAFSLYFAGRKYEAIKELRNVLILDPNNVWAYGYIALIYGELNEIDKAIDAAKTGLKIDTNVAALHLLLSQGYYKKNDSWGGFIEAANALRLKAQGF